MTAARLIVGPVLMFALSACGTAADRRVDDSVEPVAAGTGQLPARTDSRAEQNGTAPSEEPVSILAAATSPDRDGDLVLDELDQCADSEPGSAVDAMGCAVFNGAIENLEFAPDDDDLNAQARAALDALIANLEAFPDVVIAVDGHTDNRGPAANNLDLSKRRVIAVVRYLVEQGVPASRLKPYGYGESRPMKSNATPEGRRSNRRIEVREVEA